MRKLNLTGYKCNAPDDAVRIPTAAQLTALDLKGQITLSPAEFAAVLEFQETAKTEYQSIYVWVTTP